jgi:hypothetical protein
MTFLPLLLKFSGLIDIAIGLFDASNTSRHGLTNDLIKLLRKHDLRKKIIAYVKNGSNLNTMNTYLSLL